MLSASSTRNSTFSSPSSPATRRACSTIAGAKSVEISVPLVAQAGGGREAGVTGARRELEHGLARLRVEALDEPLPDQSRRLPDIAPLAPPRRGKPVPAVLAGLAVFVEVHASRV